MEYREIFWELYHQEAYIAIFCLLMDSQIRSCYFPKNKTTPSSDINEYPVVDDINQIKTALEYLQEDIYDTKVKCGDCLQVFEIKSTGENWRTSEKFSREKEYMIIRAPENGKISRVVNNYEDAEPFNDNSEEKFKIIKGIQYQSYYNNDKFYYMEV